MPTYAESIAIRRAFLADLNRLEGDAVGEIARHYGVAMSRIEADITRALEMDTPLGRAILDSFAGAEDTARVSVIRGRADFILGELERFAKTASTITEPLAGAAYGIGVKTASEQFQGISANLTTPSRRTIEQTVARLQEGTAQQAYFSGFARQAGEEVITEVIQGVIAGENPKKIARRIQDQMTIGNARVRTAVRTEVLGAARSGLLDSYRENSDVLEGWVWNADESPRTCEVCWAMNGTLHTLDEDLDSHPNCRCTPSPVTQTFAQILGDAGMDSGGITETRIESFDPDAKFDAVLNEAEKVKVLGPGKYALWRDGEIRLGDLVTPTDNPVWGPGLRATTLRELRERGVVPAPVMERVARGKRRT